MPKEDIEQKSEEAPLGVILEREDLLTWKPKTSLGIKVRNKEITDIDEILDKGVRILEQEIVDILLPNLETEFIFLGQSKGKFGGGKRSIWRQTQKKTSEGNKPKFATMIVVGNRDGYVGVGFGKSKETMPAREKAIRRAKMNIIKIPRGCGSWECVCNEAHSIPFKTLGKLGGIEIELIPAPKGTGLCVQEELKKIFQLAGIKDIYSKTKGPTKTRINLVKACFAALKNLSKFKVDKGFIKKKGIVSGKI